jgi:hypothetical protein
LKVSLVIIVLAIAIVISWSVSLWVILKETT